MSAFVSLSSLTWLSLAGCSLSTISPNAFASPSPLRHLDLSDNQLSSLPAFVNFQRIPSLFLERNPWHCDCALRELKLNSQAICSTPQKLKGFELNELSECSFLQVRILLYPLINFFFSGNVRPPLPGDRSAPPCRRCPPSGTPSSSSEAFYQPSSATPPSFGQQRLLFRPIYRSLSF